jgi:hypothetical protein
MKSRLVGGVVLLGLALGTGCGAGAFRQAVTSDRCKVGDDGCVRALDAPIAVGAEATPDVHARIDGSGTPSLHLETAAPSILDVREGRVVGRAEGMSALLFVADGGTVIDLLHVWVKKPTALELDATLPGRAPSGRIDGRIDVFVGEELRVSARPVADGQRLAGEAETAWKIEPPLLTLLREGADDGRRLVAEAPGQAVLSVTSLGLERQIPIVVHAREAAKAPRGERGAS